MANFTEKFHIPSRFNRNTAGCQRQGLGNVMSFLISTVCLLYNANRPAAHRHSSYAVGFFTLKDNHNMLSTVYIFIRAHLACSSKY